MVRYFPYLLVVISLLKGQSEYTEYPWVLVDQWIERPFGVREVMGSIPVGNSDFSLSHARVMSISSLFIFHYRARQDSPSLFIYTEDCWELVLQYQRTFHFYLFPFSIWKVMLSF